MRKPVNSAFYGLPGLCWTLIGRPACTIFELILYGFKATCYLRNIKSNILYYPGQITNNRLIILNKSIIYAVVIGICAFDNAFGQTVKDCSYSGLEDMHYVSHAKHNVLRWYHLTYLTIKDDSVWVSQAPVAINKHDTIWSASDGAFYYYEGTVKIKGKQITMNLGMTNCDYCGIPEDSARRDQFFHRIWSGKMMDDGITIDGSFYSRTNHEAMRWRNRSNE